MKLRHLILTLFVAFLATFNASAQETRTYNKENCDKYRSLYYQYLKQEMYRDAMTFWAMAYDYCGGSDSADVKLFTNGRAGYLKLYGTETDEKRKTEIRDSIYWIYDNLIRLEPTNYDWQISYATMMVNEGDTRYDKIEALYQAIHKKKNATSYYDIRVYFKHLIVNKYNNAPADKRDEVRAFIIEEYMLLSDYVSTSAKNLREKGDEEGAKKYDSAQEFMDKYLLQIVNDCSILTGVVEKKIGSLPQDRESKIAKLNAYIQLLDKKQCQKTDTYSKLLDTLLAVDPSANAYNKTGVYYLQNDQPDKAVNYFEKAVEMEGAGENKDEYLYNLALSQYAAKKYRAAYSTAKMVEGKNKGKAMKICGDSIAQLANSCGESTFERKANFWLANDYYKKAAALGEDVSSSKYLDNAPSSEEIFSAGYRTGDSISLSCWGESTTIR